MGNWDYEEGVAGVRNTGKGVVPSDEGSKESEDTTSLDESVVNLSNTVQDEVSDCQHEEGHVEEEEEQEEGDGRAECAEEEKGREDEPSSQEESDSVVEISVGVVLGVCGGNLESSWGVDDSVREPETTVRRKCSSTESVANGHFPVILLVSM